MRSKCDNISNKKLIKIQKTERSIARQELFCAIAVRSPLLKLHLAHRPSRPSFAPRPVTATSTHCCMLSCCSLFASACVPCTCLHLCARGGPSSAIEIASQSRTGNNNTLQVRCRCATLSVDCLTACDGSVGFPLFRPPTQRLGCTCRGPYERASGRPGMTTGLSKVR